MLRLYSLRSNSLFPYKGDNMISIRDVMTTDHKRCDALYAKAELYVSNNDWDNAQIFANDFIESLLSHFTHEEDILFPAFEDATGMRHGPTE